MERVRFSNSMIEDKIKQAQRNLENIFIFSKPKMKKKKFKKRANTKLEREIKFIERSYLLVQRINRDKEARFLNREKRKNKKLKIKLAEKILKA